MRFFLTLAVALALFACEKRQPASGPSAKSGSTTSGESQAAVSIAYIPKNTGNPYFDSLIKRMREACDELGAEFTTTAPATPEATAQIPFIKDQIQLGADVICISPTSADTANNVLDDARARGIKIVMVNGDIAGYEEHRDACILPTDFDAIGAEQIELLGSLIGYEGSFAILSATTDAPDQNYWIDGMKEALKDPKYARMKLVTIVYGDDEPQKSRTEAESLLTRYPDLRAILSPTSVGVEQAAKTVEAAGVYPGGPNAAGSGIVVTGLGTPNQMRRYIKDGIVPAIGLWSPPDEGYIAGYLAHGLATGQIQPAPGVSFSVPGYGIRTFRENNIVITGPPLVFTKENVDEYHF